MSKYQDSSTEELLKKKRGLKTLMLLFSVLSALLFASVLWNFFKGEKTDWSILTIAICTVGGIATVYPEMKAINKALVTTSKRSSS